jgi:hypothetical protein
MDLAVEWPLATFVRGHGVARGLYPNAVLAELVAYGGDSTVPHFAGSRQIELSRSPVISGGTSISGPIPRDPRIQTAGGVFVSRANYFD